MIEPRLSDIGRKVVYRARHPGAQPEDGVLASFNESCVFVRYGSDQTAKSTARADLEWLAPPARRPRARGLRAMPPYTVAREDHTRRIQALHAAISRREWSEVERAAATIRDAFDRPDLDARALTDTPESFALRFGDGRLVIAVGTFHERPAVFVKPAKVAGAVGDKVRDADKGPLDQLEPGEIVWTFPTMRQAETVRDALFGLLAPAKTGA